MIAEGLFTKEALLAEIEAGWVRVQTHPTLPLNIYNYTESAQYCNHWNDVTLSCRGLILDDDYNLVARPWRKFFNFGQRDLEIAWDAPVEVTDKLDGSLGILYPEQKVQKWNGGNPIWLTDYAIATRGSFASDQALHATEVWDEKYAPYLSDLLDWFSNYTFLFEIIYPANRVVLNYGDMDDLVLLGAVENTRGFYVGPQTAAGMLDWEGPTADVLEYDQFKDAVSAPDRGKEGIVIRSGQKMVKLKEADYVELHRIVTNLSAKTVWSQLVEGKTVQDICEDIPDEWHEWVRNVGDGLVAEHGQTVANAVDHFISVKQSLPEDFSRKQFAQAVQKPQYKPYAKYLFLLLDERPIRDVVWQSIKPRGDE